MIGGLIGESCQRVLNRIVRLLARLNPNPNLLSVIGLGINIWRLCSTASAGSFWPE
jgi:hypothetical protein